MALGININFSPERGEQINGRLLALQVEIGGCVIYVADNEIRWEPEPHEWPKDVDEEVHMVLLINVVDKLIEFEVIDPTQDEYVLSTSDLGEKDGPWADGFHAGFRNGIAFRNNSIPALQAALSEAEGKVKEEATRANCYADENHVLRNLRDKLGPFLQSTGDGIANIFDQLEKGNWVDDHGHLVKNNVHMLAMQSILLAIMHFRSDHLDYEKVDIPLDAKPTPCSGPGCPETWEGSDAFPSNG